MLLRDPVHDLVRFEAEEEEIVPALLDTTEVQRLRRIRQLGVTHLVFHGAEHSRFTHALGAAHVMKRLIGRLREIHEQLPFWQRLASDRARDALAAALLHDVGHGPYSHLFEEALPNAPMHETWSLRIVRDPSTRVHQVLVARDPSLPERVAQLIAGGNHHEQPYPLPYLAHAVSGTFDVDRCDYLLRDAHMTGVRYGLFDLDWLLRSLRFAAVAGNAAPHFAIDGYKGLPAIEGFLLARRFMFEQVYLHKATRAAEALIKAIFARAVALLADGTLLPSVPEALMSAARGKPISLDAYLALDDIRIGAAFAAWEGVTDPILADLCIRLRARRLPKTIEMPFAKDPTKSVDELRHEASDRTRALGLDPAFHVHVDVAEDSLRIDDHLSVVLGEGVLQSRPLQEISPLLAQLAAVPLQRTRLIVPAEVRDAMAPRARG